jgi:metacaspase-1
MGFFGLTGRGAARGKDNVNDTIDEVRQSRSSRSASPARPPPQTAESAEAEERFLQQSQALIPADVYMISGSHSLQTSADVQDASHLLPRAKGKSNGACTAALLDILYKYNKSRKTTTRPLTFQQLLLELRSSLQRSGFDQIPQLTSSRPLESSAKGTRRTSTPDVDDFSTPFSLSPIFSAPSRDQSPGTRRALLVGINYYGQNPGYLSGCVNDVFAMKEYLETVAGFDPQNVLVLVDTPAEDRYEEKTHRFNLSPGEGGGYHPPTRQAIMLALQQLVILSQPGDSIYLHYSGHGGLLQPSPSSNAFKFNLWNERQRELSRMKSMESFSGRGEAVIVGNLGTPSRPAEFFDEVIYPVNHESAGAIRDLSIYNNFVKQVRPGVHVVSVWDCCHAGTIMELPFSYQPTPSGQLRMKQSMDQMTNLAFLYLMAGEMLPGLNLFTDVARNIEQATGRNVEVFLGTGVSELESDYVAHAAVLANVDNADDETLVYGDEDDGDEGGLGTMISNTEDDDISRDPDSIVDLADAVDMDEFTSCGASSCLSEALRALADSDVA